MRVKSAPLQPLSFSEPTSIDIEPGGTVLLVENSPGRVLRVNTRTELVTTVVPSMTRPYAVARAPSGNVFVSSENLLSQIGASGALATIAQADSDIGPLAVASNGDVYFSTAARLFRLPGGAGPPIPLNAEVSDRTSSRWRATVRYSSPTPETTESNESTLQAARPRHSRRWALRSGSTSAPTGRSMWSRGKRVESPT